MKSENPGYHINVIKKGVYGQISKVMEEFDEVMDSWEQKSPIMAMVELSDMLGAIEACADAELFNQCMEMASIIVDSSKRKTSWWSRKPAPPEISAIEGNLTLATFEFVAHPEDDKFLTYVLVFIMQYFEHYNLSIDDAMKMNHITKRAFINGRRQVSN